MITKIKQKKNKVIVAMSGGVDSSVSAVLLKRAGFDLIGVFMKFWQAPEGNGKGWNRCCSVESASRARQTARKLGIPFYVLNVEKEFKKIIVDYFLNEYKAGRTPNPCVLCNKEIKFKFLIKKAFELGADFVATGHYARQSPAGLCREFSISNFQFSNNFQFSIFKAKDKTKDQSYFLWKLGQKELNKILFPVGNYTKKQVRELAEKFDLPSAKTKESQEVCFIKTTTNEFLKKYLKEKPGLILDKQGKEIGKHNGLWFYTIGQRKGIKLSGGPYYVVEKDIKKNLLIVSKNKRDLLKKEIILKDINWISGKPPKLPFRASVQIRYNSKPAPAIIKKISANRYKIVFDKPQPSPTPAQSAVLYSRSRLLAGGIII